MNGGGVGEKEKCMKDYTSSDSNSVLVSYPSGMYFTITSAGAVGSNNTYFTNNPISEINFPEYVDGIQCKSIADSTFNMYSGLPNFRYTILKITMPDSITSIGDNSFKQNYSLTTLELSQNLVYIGQYVFQSMFCLQSVTVPRSVRSLGKLVFNGWTSSQTIIFEDFNNITSLDELWNSGCNANIIYL